LELGETIKTRPVSRARSMWIPRRELNVNSKRKYMYLRIWLIKFHLAVAVVPQFSCENCKM
jgi:hypothetical protein